ncbi:hypothetical protein BGW80DRAFT_1457182 [Lactifluus volemus]|nr:hypothetical protein BGW80DRAFT_1457182 [Lactifluus volemus]
MATSPATSEGTSNGSNNNSFDDPDADIILRSCDSQEFRVLKLYLIRSSPVLKRLIQEAAIPPDVGTPSRFRRNHRALIGGPKVPNELHLESHTGNDLSTRPPFIRRENAFHVYSLARKHVLFQEAAQAARITLKYILTIEKLEDKLDVVPGAHLYELWEYHRGVQANISSDILEFRTSGAHGTLAGLNCVAFTGILPKWLDDYICSIAYTPSFFDPAEFQTTLASHIIVTYCQCCSRIPSQTIHAFWSALTDVVQQSMKRAESTLSWQPTPTAQARVEEELVSPARDVIILSSDDASFPFHKSILASSSQIFRDIFSLPQPSISQTFVNGLPVVRVPEKANILRALITVLYPIPSEIPSSYSDVLALLATAQKYEMLTIQSAIRAEVCRRNLLAPIGAEASVFTVANKNRLLPEAQTAARLTLNHPLTFEFLGNGLRLVEGWALCELARFRKSCRDRLVSCLESFLDIRNGPSKIWKSCSKLNEPPQRYSRSSSDYQHLIPTLPSWLHNLFKQQIGELEEVFTKPLLNPSNIRDKYFEALWAHVRTSGGCTCLMTHTLEGEKYCVELEHKLTGALDEASPPSTFLEIPWK